MAVRIKKKPVEATPESTFKLPPFSMRYGTIFYSVQVVFADSTPVIENNLRTNIVKSEYEILGSHIFDKSFVAANYAATWLYEIHRLTVGSDKPYLINLFTMQLTVYANGFARTTTFPIEDFTIATHDDKRREYSSLTTYINESLHKLENTVFLACEKETSEATMPLEVVVNTIVRDKGKNGSEDVDFTRTRMLIAHANAMLEAKKAAN